VSVVLIAAHTWTIMRFPNNLAEANRIRANNQVRHFLIWIDRGPDRKENERQAPESIQPGNTFWTLLVAFLVSLTLFVSCDVLRWVQGWPSNAGWRPEVIGPGDSAWVFLPKTIQSLKGHWNGQADALLETTDAPGVFIPVAASTRTDGWGHMIEVKQGESNSTQHLWIRIQMPDDPKLAGKKVRVHMALNVAFPVLDWNQHQFHIRQDAVEHIEEIDMAPSGAGTTFWLAWYAGTIFPYMVLLALQFYCMSRAYHLKLYAGTSEVTPCDQPTPPPEEEADDALPPAAPQEDGTSIREERYPRRSTGEAD
jgi:hypothetical protein